MPSRFFRHLLLATAGVTWSQGYGDRGPETLALDMVLYWIDVEGRIQGSGLRAPSEFSVECLDGDGEVNEEKFSVS